jgi:hypothetical protein
VTMYKTLLLDQDAWDLVLDSAGNIALAAPPYALAQDVGSAVKLFIGELWYDTSKGIPYFEKILGKTPPSSLIVELIRKAALTVPGVVSAQCVISAYNRDGRTVSGQIQFTDESGVITNVNF